MTAAVGPGRFTGERLHADEQLFAVDLARHRAAYRFAADRRPATPILDVGAGSGHGIELLAEARCRAIALDRVLPDPPVRSLAAGVVLADVERLPFPERTFGRIVSFQVIEHLGDPRAYLEGLARALAPDGEALFTTPNRLLSDQLNPYHEHEYVADELARVLAEHFARVQMLGIAASPRLRPYFEQRLATLRRVRRLDVLRLHRRLPRGLRLWLFARAAVMMRRFLRGRGVAPEGVDERELVIGPVDEHSLDLLAVCASPR